MTAYQIQKMSSGCIWNKKLFLVDLGKQGGRKTTAEFNADHHSDFKTQYLRVSFVSQEGNQVMVAYILIVQLRDCEMAKLVGLYSFVYHFLLLNHCLYNRDNWLDNNTTHVTPVAVMSVAS